MRVNLISYGRDVPQQYEKRSKIKLPVETTSRVAIAEHIFAITKDTVGRTR